MEGLPAPISIGDSGQINPQNPVQYHTHNGIDSPQITVNSLGPDISTGGPKTATFVVGPSSNSDSGTYDYVTDGTADDVQIQAAITALPTNGGSICLREGSYVLAATLTVAKDGVHIYGMGMGTRISAAAGFAVPFFTLGHASTTYYDFFLHHVYIDANNLNANDVFVIDNRTASRPIINAVYSDNYMVNAGSGFLLCANRSYDVFERNYVSTWDGQGVDSFKNTCIGGDARVINNTFVASSTTCSVYLGVNTTAAGVFSFNDISLPASYNALAVTNATVIEGNKMYLSTGGAGASAIGISQGQSVTSNYIDFGSSPNVLSVGIKAWITVTGNYIVAGKGVTFPDNGVSTVIGNFIAAQGHGIHVDFTGASTSHHRVTSNRIKAGQATTNTYSGILVADGVPVIIDSNTISTDGSSNVVQYGIREAGTGCVSIVTSNQVYNAGTAAISIQGNATIVDNNYVV